MNERWITIYQCSQHPQFISLCVDQEESGERVLGGKCCQFQYAKTIKTWKPTMHQWEDLGRCCEEALEDGKK